MFTHKLLTLKENFLFMPFDISSFQSSHIMIAEMTIIIAYNLGFSFIYNHLSMSCYSCKILILIPKKEANYLDNFWAMGVVRNKHIVSIPPSSQQRLLKTIWTFIFLRLSSMAILIL